MWLGRSIGSSERAPSHGRARVMLPNLSDSERHFLQMGLMESSPQQVAAASQVAIFLAEGEENLADALLVYTYYYSQPENEVELRDVMAQIGLNEY